MPRYDYHCNECGIRFEVSHAMTEVIEKCLECNSEGTIFRVPSLLRARTSSEPQGYKPGVLVKEFIEETRSDIEEQKYNFARGYESGS